MSLPSTGKSDQSLDLVKLHQKKVMAKALEELDLLKFGPCSITSQAWRRLLLTTRSLSAKPRAREVPLALVARLHGTRLLIEDFVQLVGESGGSFCKFTIEDVKKVDREAGKRKMFLAGLLHTHPELEPIPSHQDRVSWLALMFEFNRPLLYFVLNPESLRLAAYSIPAKIFYRLKDSIKFVEFEMTE